MMSSVINLLYISIKKIIFPFSLAAIIVSCNDENNKTSTPATDYLNKVIDVMEAHSINRDNIDWTDFRKKVLEHAGAAHEIEDTYDAIHYAIGLLGDNHTFYVTHSSSHINNSTLQCADLSPGNVEVPDGIGYTKVTGFSGGGNEAVQFAQAIQNEIKLQDNTELKGWIVDLRGNTGGNMWPMIAGLGPIAGEGTLGYFIDPAGNTQTWSYSNGASMIDGSTVTQTVPYQLLNPNPKVAILWDQGTASSGEATAIAFINRPNTKSFGRPSCGASTANAYYDLGDGSGIYLTVSYMADRSKKKYGTQLTPDEIIEDPSSVLQKSIDWINN